MKYAEHDKHIFRMIRSFKGAYFSVLFENYKFQRRLENTPKNLQKHTCLILKTGEELSAEPRNARIKNYQLRFYKIK